MSVLVIGSPTEDFSVGKGLMRQGDPLSPFLFLIVAEGLIRMMQKAVDNGSFHSYK
ncbi:LINE-1 reverse transcriptase like, partial [Trifolium medium]|nr:LINE-1 reverse transcriptase like [Trifolium medium]